MKFLSLFTGMGWQTKAMLYLAIAFAAFCGGWKVHAWKTDAALARSINRTEITRQKDIAQAGKIVKNVETQKEVIRYVTKEIIKEIPALPDADHVCFTNESLSLWNRAIASTDNDRTKPDDAAKTADSAETNFEVIATVEDVLENATENYAVCNENAANHNALIDRLESLEGKMCYCAE